MEKQLKDINRPQSFEDLMAALKAMYRFDFTRQQAGYIIVKLMGLQRRFKRNYVWDDFFNAQQSLDSKIKGLVRKWSSDMEDAPEDDTEVSYNEPDETDMDYVSNQLLMKDIYGEGKIVKSIISETINNFLRKQCYREGIWKK